MARQHRQVPARENRPSRAVILALKADTMLNRAERLARAGEYWGAIRPLACGTLLGWQAMFYHRMRRPDKAP